MLKQEAQAAFKTVIEPSNDVMPTLNIAGEMIASVD